MDGGREDAVDCRVHWRPGGPPLKRAIGTSPITQPWNKLSRPPALPWMPPAGWRNPDATRPVGTLRMDEHSLVLASPGTRHRRGNAWSGWDEAIGGCSRPAPSSHRPLRHADTHTPRWGTRFPTDLVHAGETRDKLKLCTAEDAPGRAGSDSNRQSCMPAAATDASATDPPSPRADVFPLHLM